MAQQTQGRLVVVSGARGFPVLAVVLLGEFQELENDVFNVQGLPVGILGGGGQRPAIPESGGHTPAYWLCCCRGLNNGPCPERDDGKTAALVLGVLGDVVSGSWHVQILFRVRNRIYGF